METPLRVLMVEDSEDDAELVARTLRRGGYVTTIERVDTSEALKTALEKTWDLIISDFAMPRFGGLDALRIVRDRGLDVPFLLVSGTIGEETAVLAMRAGAHDYLLKHNLARLVPAVARELAEAEVRRERRRAQESLRVLADWSVTLAESLDYAAILSRVSRLAIPFLADFCTVDLVAEDGSIDRVASAHAIPAEEARLREVHQSFPPILAAEALRTGRPELVADASEAFLLERCAGADHVKALRSLGTHSLLAVPLVARAENIGVITLVGTASRPHYGPSDVALAQELARRAALAIDNARLYLEAQEAIQEAKGAIRARDEFLVIAAHELRTPLTPLLLQIQTARRLAREKGGGDPEAIRGRLANAERQITRLAGLVNTLLDVSRLTAKADLGLTLTTFNLSALAAEIAARFAEELVRAGCSLMLRAEQPVVGTWDRQRLDQVISNLLSNALKYGAGSPVVVEVRGDDASAFVSVRDSGIGISPEDRERIFERFERAVPVSHYGGFGVGLWIAKRIVDSLGGAIRVETEAGKGSSFTIQLPRVSVSDEAKEGAGAATVSAAPAGGS